mmetsp:Transcript_101472/g.180353  ORF Transcript_101472/g.180353 Transcript_101472/m.180353 type:complete len:207 (-) Transcript_101472:79-699(-)
MGMIFGKIDVAQPEFKVMQRMNGYEVRQVATYCIAEVVGGASSSEEFGNRHFRTLAQYIGVFGAPNNTRRESMDMTAPVLSSKGEPEKMDMTAPVLSSASKENYAMSFILPSQYSVENAPVPHDQGIRLRQVPSRRIAVQSFSGNVDDEAAAEKALWLLEQVKQDGYRLAQPPVDTFGRGWELARFNPPFTIPFLKTNEIQVHLSE